MAQVVAESFKSSASRTFAYLDFDVNNHRTALSRAAAFVHATDQRYAWTSKELRLLVLFSVYFFSKIHLVVIG